MKDSLMARLVCPSARATIEKGRVVIRIDLEKDPKPSAS
jgi:hypothetical protein